MRSVDKAEPAGKRVLVRVDFNVPLAHGEVEDDSRIRAALPTIEQLLDRGARAIALCSHLGRPNGTDPGLTLAPVAARLSELLALEVPLLADCVGVDIPDGVSLLENVRFHAEEERDLTDLRFRRAVAGLENPIVLREKRRDIAVLKSMGASASSIGRILALSCPPLSCRHRTCPIPMTPSRASRRSATPWRRRRAGWPTA